MKKIKRVIFLISFALLGCQNEKSNQESGTEKTFHTEVVPLSKEDDLIEKKMIDNETIDLSNLNGSIWVNTPMKEFPDCIDSLKFGQTELYDYSCEHEYGEKHGYKINGDTIYIEKWDVINEVDTTTQLSAKEWYILTENGLVWVKVQRKRGDLWDDLDSKYLNKFFYKKVK